MSVLLADLKLLFLLIFSSLIFLLLDNFHLLNLPKSILQFITTPIQFGLYQTGTKISRQFEFVYLTRRAAQENKALKEQQAHLLIENATLRKDLSEAKALISQQDSLSPQTYNLVTARVVGFSRYLTIDKGSDDGISVDAVVVLKDSYIGKVKEVNPKTSLVMLSHDPDSKVAVFARSKDGKARGILVGQFGSELLMDKILHQESLEVGDLVYSEGTEGQLPRGLIIGTVSQVLENQNEVFKQAKVKSIFEVPDLEVVFVIKDL